MTRGCYVWGLTKKNSLDDCERAMITMAETAAAAVEREAKTKRMDTILVAKKEVVNQSPNLLQRLR